MTAEGRQAGREADAKWYEDLIELPDLERKKQLETKVTRLRDFVTDLYTFNG